MKTHVALLFITVVLTSGCVQNNSEYQNSGQLELNNSAQQTTTQSHNDTAENSNKQELYNSVKREIEALFQENPQFGVSPPHYQRIKNDLDSLEGVVPDEEALLLKQKLETINPDKKNPVEKQTNPQKCVSNPSPVFTADITDTKTIRAVSPPRNEKTHSHVWIKDSQKVPVHMPVDARLAAGSKYLENDGLNYLLFFDVSCEVEIKFDHLEELIPALENEFPSPPKTEDTKTDYLTAIEFKAGDLIGYTTGTPLAKNWDFGAYNKAKPNHLNGKPGYAELDMRAGCPYDYFTADKKKFYYNLFTGATGSGVAPTEFCGGD